MDDSRISSYLWANWPAPKSVRALTTTRLGGASSPPYDHFNLGLHCGDNPQAVLANRARLRTDLGFVHPPLWLDQVHSADVVRLEDYSDASPHMPGQPKADASITALVQQPCIVMTADCLPILLCDRTGQEVAAIHGGWRGLQAGIIGNTVAAMAAQPDTLMAWLGPAIGAQAFEVGVEVREAFVGVLPGADKAFVAGRGDRLVADIFELARMQLKQAGVTQIYDSELCTVSDPQRFYSYRRDGRQTGRMASCIWIDAEM